MPLTDLAVKKAKAGTKNYKLADSHGLVLEVSTAGGKLWRYRYKLHGKEGMHALGRYPEVTLAQARTLRDAARVLVQQGRNPTIERKAAIQAEAVKNAGTVKAVASEWFEKRVSNWSEIHAKRVQSILDVEIFPVIGSLPVSAVRLAHVKACMKAATQRGAKHTALRVSNLLYSIFNHAMRHELCEYNPAASMRGEVIPDRPRHAVALGKADFAELLKKVSGYGNPTVRIGLMLLAHCLVRTQELRLATWDEFDFQSSEWRIPPEHMKKRRLHIVPLTRQTVALLQELKSINHDSRFLFPNERRPDAPMAARTANNALDRMGYKGIFSCHGFRATGSTFLNEGCFVGSDGRPVQFSADCIERQLAHIERNATRRSYDRSEHLAQRRVMMNVYSDFLDSLMNDGNVVQLAGQRRKRQ